MSLKKILMLPLALSLLLALYFSDKVTQSFQTLLDTVHINTAFVLVVVGAVVLQIIGHVIRAYKMRYLLAPVKVSTTRFQFRALSLGYLFDSLLPFKIGELVRAQTIAAAEKMSFGLALVLIALERAIDALLLALIGSMLCATGIIGEAAWRYVIILAVIGGGVLLTISLVGSENTRLLKLWHSSTEVFNARVKRSLRFKLWSIIYGLQRIVTTKRLLRFLGLTLLSWLFYIASIVLLAQYFVGDASNRQKTAVSVSPYYGVSLPTGPASLGSYSKIANTVAGDNYASADNRLTVDLVAWAVLVVPVSALGVIFLLVKTKEPLWRKLPAQSSHAAMYEKLSRAEDISLELDGFLDSYFSGNGLSQIVHRLELKKDFSLLRYFKGGSDAITILALQNDNIVVKKIIPPEFRDRLKAQHDWLVRHKKNSGIVRVLKEYDKADYYAIDLAYDENNEMFFDFLHRNPVPESQKILDAVWGYLAQTLYQNTDVRSDPVALQQYIDTHIFGCLEKAAAVNEELRLASQPKRIKINGKQYDNLNEVMSKIMANKKIMQELATYAHSSEVHGDVAVDNVLVSSATKKALLIDPAPDGNIMNGPAFDFGKNMQSLYCGYEFLFRGNETVQLSDAGEIRYSDHRSTQYRELCDYVRQELAPQYLTAAEQKAMLFHAAALHIRRLKHQVYQNPANVLAFYATGVKTLNDFLAQYE